MRKTLLVFATAALFSIASTLNAQNEQCFKVGASAINLGVGVGNTISYGGIYAYGGVGSPVFTPAFTASYEYGIAHVGIGIIGAGLEFGFQGTHYDYAGTPYRERWTTLAFSPRATYHFDVINKNKLDIYAIVQINIYANSYSDNSPYYVNSPNGTYTTYSSHSVGVRPGIMAAIRYHFTPNFGVFSELGYDISIIKAGITFKFGGK